MRGLYFDLFTCNEHVVTPETVEGSMLLFNDFTQGSGLVRRQIAEDLGQDLAQLISECSLEGDRKLLSVDLSLHKIASTALKYLKTNSTLQRASSRGYCGKTLGILHAVSREDAA